MKKYFPIFVLIAILSISSQSFAGVIEGSDVRVNGVIEGSDVAAAGVIEGSDLTADILNYLYGLIIGD